MTLLDADYVKAELARDYETERAHEHPYPELDSVIDQIRFNYLAGTIELENPSGIPNRDGMPYLQFTFGDKKIYSHRFIVAVTLMKWPPRAFDIDHVDHNPSNNRPTNLRVVTPRDNAGNRRTALLSEIADLDQIAETLRERFEQMEAETKNSFPLAHDVPVREKPSAPARPHQARARDPAVGFGQPFGDVSGPIPAISFTGETKPAKHSDGTWHKTNLGSWHLRFDK